MMRALSHSFARFFSSISLLPYATAVLLTVSFPRLDLWFLAWISLVPLMFSLDGKSRAESFRFSYFCGVLFFGATLFWLCFVTRLGTVLFVAYLALYFGLFGLGYYYFSRTKFLVRLFLLPALWVALEYTRAHFLTGFGWVCLGHTQYQNLWLIQIADIVGVYGLSFLVVMVNVVFKEAVTYGKERQRPTKEFLAGGAIAIFLIAASVVYSAGQLDRKFEGPPVKIGLVQGNVPHERRWHSKAWPFILRDHTDLSQQLAHEGVDLIVWPESAYPGYCWEDPELFAHLQESIRRQRTAHLIGVVTKEKEDYFNSALSFDKDGVVVQRYHKIRLVPFGEFIPLRKQLPFLSALVPIDDFTPGQEFVLFNVPHWQSAKEYFYSTLICFEDTLPDIARGFVKRGAHLLINISNDAWFEDTCEPFVHLQNAVFRSVENRRWLVRCGNVGVSCFVDPWGRIMAAAADKSGKRTYVESTSVATAVLLESQTLYTKFGDWFAYFCISGILVGAIALKVQNQKNQMRKYPMIEVIFFWCEIIFAGRILFATLPLAWAGIVAPAQYASVQDPMLALLSLLAVLYLMAGLAGLRKRPTAKFLHLAAALATLVICLRLASADFAEDTSVGFFTMAFGLYSLWMVYFFVFRFKTKACSNQGASAMSKTILVVDDDKGLIKMLETGLATKGYTVLAANTGEGGLQIAQNKAIDLILLDVILPGVKGRQVCAKLKENPVTRDIPVVFLTSKNSPDDIKAELAAGAIAHITKPVDLHELFKKLEEVLPAK